MSQSSSFPAGIFRRNQTERAGDRLATLKPLRSPDDQHKRQRSQGTDPGPWLVCTTKVYSGVGADIVMESLRSKPRNERYGR